MVVSDSDEPLSGRRLSDAPHLHPGAILLLPAGAVGAASGPAAQRRRRQAHRGQDQEQQQDGGRQAGGQQEVRGRSLSGQLGARGEGRGSRFIWNVCAMDLWMYFTPSFLVTLVPRIPTILY